MAASKTKAGREGIVREAAPLRSGYLRVNHDLLESLLRLPRGSIFKCEDGGPCSALIYVQHASLPERRPGQRVPKIGDACVVLVGDPAPPIDQVAVIDSELGREVARQRFAENASRFAASVAALSRGIDEELTLP